MEFGPDHYTRDWNLLAGICQEWTEIRGRLRLGARATREQIEAVWDKIFKTPEGPPVVFIRRVFDEMMRDPALARHLRVCWWRTLRPWERKGYTFEEIHPEVLLRLFWTVVRNACTWGVFRGTMEHWARFWNTKNLTEELRRAINDMWESEAPQDDRLPDDPEAPPPTPAPEGE